MKLPSALITIAAAIGLRTNGVTGASIVDRHVKSMTATQLFPGEKFGIDIDASEKSCGEVATRRTDRFIGSAWLGNTLLREMREFAGVYSPDRDLSSDDVLHNMRMTHIVKTSPLHTDEIVDGGGRATAGLSQGFYVLNDNPHAYFERTFITFNGRRPHRTVIGDGSVDLLGPFDLDSLKCVKASSRTTSDSGKVQPVQDSNRQLGEETDTGRLISGNVFRGIKVYDYTEEIIGHHIAHNVTGLPPCLNCDMSIAFSTAQECTKETHDEATMIPSLSDLTYNTDDEGNTGVKWQEFIAGSDHPIGKQFFSYAQNVYEDPTQAQASSFSVFFYDEEGELVACSFLQPILSDEDEELAAEILAIITANLDNEIEGATPIGAIGNGGNSAGNLMFSFLPIVVSAAACVFVS